MFRAIPAILPVYQAYINHLKIKNNQGVGGREEKSKASDPSDANWNCVYIFRKLKRNLLVLKSCGMCIMKVSFEKKLRALLHYCGNNARVLKRLHYEKN